MIISIASAFTAIFKLVCLIGWAGVSAIWFMWPINDRPTSKTQVGVWVAGLVIVTTLLFTHLIQFTS